MVSTIYTCINAGRIAANTHSLSRGPYRLYQVSAKWVPCWSKCEVTWGNLLRLLWEKRITTTYNQCRVGCSQYILPHSITSHTSSRYLWSSMVLIQTQRVRLVELACYGNSCHGLEDWVIFCPTLGCPCSHWSCSIEWKFWCCWNDDDKVWMQTWWNGCQGNNNKSTSVQLMSCINSCTGLHSQCCRDCKKYPKEYLL